jgi:transcription-repair coupling factor (superfamily II helicase)
VSLSSIYQRIATAPTADRLRAWSRTAEAPATLEVDGGVGSLPAFLLTRLRRDLDRPIVCLTTEADGASYLVSDLEQVAGSADGLVLFPPSGHTPYDQEQVEHADKLIARADVLQQLAEGFRGVLVTSVEAIMELVPPSDRVQQETLALELGVEIPPTDLVELLTEQGFTRTEFAEEPGDLAVRGGIVDVYPFSGEYPIRIEFFGDEIDSLREFDPATQRSVSRLTSTRLVPNLERQHETEGTFTSLFDYLPDETLFATFDEARLVDAADARFEKAADAYDHAEEHFPDVEHALPEVRYLNGARLEAALLAHARLLFGTFTGSAATEQVTIDAKPQPAFNGNLDLLRDQIHQHAARHIDVTILCNSEGQESRLFDLLQDEVERGQLTLKVEAMHEGFEVPDLGLAVYTDHQIFNRYFRPSTRRQRRQGGLSLRELKNLSPGDFVVHLDYGIGKFVGLRKITVRGKQQEAVKVLFKEDDVLYVNVNALYKLHKYSGKEGTQPTLTKLGSGQWERTKSRTKSRVKDIARDLIKLYAERKASDGFAFSEDTVWQREMEASFEFEDTPDQASATRAVKDDMEDPVPMDRLVCGDVGFGKTEVAVRAAFKAVQDGKQVAVLVPTTILAQQHYETFRRRMDRFPVRVEMLSRFRTTGEQKEVIDGLKAGTVDLVVGTHRLTSKDVGFKDLGLLIIDEEQRFGVAVKERLRKLRVDVDTLTLTATPIPRTLQFSLLGARDLSIIGTPPPNRQPIVTEIHTFDKDLIRDAILYETSRGGQVFFIHNRVRTIEQMAETLRLLVPDVRIRVGHGQMKGPQLEKVMLDFIEKKYDVLVSTSIIENGLDISNANTIIIDHAEHFGLSELHQLRGRVGRSNRKAFCYLLVPSIHALTREGRQRLQAIEEFSDLGSGFSIAMRDLDIRGAGSLLGAEQSGFIDEVGFETYHRILDEAMKELRTEEFRDLFKDTPAPPPSETTVDVEEDAFIPENYVTNHLERLNLYRRISEAGTMTVLAELRDELADRFGPVPTEVEHLLLAAELKLLLQPLRVPKVVFKNQRLFVYMPTQEDDPYFYDEIFYPLLERFSHLDRRYVMKETAKSNKLRAIVQDVPDLQTAKTVAERLQLADAAAVTVEG